MREGTTKYVIHARLEANGVVERPDVVGAIFGQTEGLLGDELDLRELLKSGKIGRIQVDITSEHGKSKGVITVPSSLDRAETSLIAAALETVDRVGPCETKIKVERIEDVREAKRKLIAERAKEILKQMEEEMPESRELSERVKESTRLADIVEYEGLPAGPGVKDSDAVIIVEGRADVLNMLRVGVRNVVAIDGANIPPAVAELSKDRTATAFIDADHAGDLVLKKLLQVADIDFVARPPPGKSVQELSKKEVIKALRKKIPADQALAELNAKQRAPADLSGESRELAVLMGLAKELRGTLKGKLLDEKFEQVGELQVQDIKKGLAEAKGVKAVVFDGVVTRELVDVASERGVEYVVGMRSRVGGPSAPVRVLTLDELRRLERRG